MTERYWKVLGEDRKPSHGGSGQWYPQAWMPEIPDPVPCKRGYHLCRRQDLVRWLGPTIWEAKPGDIIIGHTDKVVTNRARLVRRVNTWNDTTARLFAADCAEQVLHIFEEQAPDDDRPREAIRTARLYVLGEPTEDVRDAAWDAVSAAAYAAWDAARSAAFARDAVSAASAYAWDAARSATQAAARSAAFARDATAYRDAARYNFAWDAARSAQTDLLFDWLEGRRTIEHVRHELETPINTSQ